MKKILSTDTMKSYHATSSLDSLDTPHTVTAVTRL